MKTGQLPLSNCPVPYLINIYYALIRVTNRDLARVEITCARH